MISQKRWIDSGAAADAPVEAPADGLWDLRTSSNALSVYLVPEENAPTLCRRIAVAMAANKSSLDHIEWVLFSRADVEALGLTLQQSPGDTGDAAVNALHYNLTDLTAAALAQIASIVHQALFECATDKVRKQALREDLLAAIREGRLERMEKNRKLFDELAVAVPE